MTLLEVVIGDCKYLKKYWKGQFCVVSVENGGRGWRPPVPESLAASQPELVSLFKDCVLDDFNERPSFLDINVRLASCKASADKFHPEEEEAYHPKKKAEFEELSDVDVSLPKKLATSTDEADATRKLYSDLQ